MDVKEFGNSIKITVAFYIFSLVTVAVGAWFVSDVHTRFKLQNDKINSNSERTEYVNDRHDRKYERMEDRIQLLERPNTDK